MTTALAIPRPLTTPSTRDRHPWPPAGQITQKLVVLIRTIEGHLYRACTKLGTFDSSSCCAGD